MKWKTSFRIWAWDFILYNLGMAYKNHFYNFICVNLKTRQQRVVGCGDIYSCQNIFYKQMTSFIRQIIFRDTWEVPQWGRVSLLAFGQAVNQSITSNQICISQSKQTNNPHKSHYYDCRLWRIHTYNICTYIYKYWATMIFWIENSGLLSQSN